MAIEIDSRYAINGIIANDDPIAEISLVGVTWNDLETSFKREVAFDPVYSTRKLFYNRKFVITTAPKHLRTHNAQILFLGIRVVGKGSWKVLSWKARHEIGKNEVGKFGISLKIRSEVGK